VRTRTELARLIADVEPERLGQGQAITAPGPRGGLTIKEGPGGDRWVISIMSGHERGGRWRIGPRCTVVNFWGGSDIDLNDAELAQPVTQLNVYSIMGGAEVRVPHGVEVQVTNFAFMGGNGVKLGDEITPAGGPIIRIRLVSIMGGTGVLRGQKPRREDRKRQKELDQAERQGELEG
jgi:Cell wall-active antibiotics response 4TMS YvqF